MKKLIIGLGLSLILLFCSSCGEEKMFENFSENALKNAERAVELNALVEKEYYVPEAEYAYHYYPNINATSNTNLSTAFAWPYTEIVASNYRLTTLSEASMKNVKDYYISSLNGFEYYRAGRNDYHCYSASRSTDAGMAGGDTYYDDNIWISREFLNAYEALGDEKYLTTSKAVAEYIWSGWAADELGGIYWKEQQKTSRNTCSNAPAVILFGRLYETTKEEKYLAQAKEVYDFCYSVLRDKKDNIYFDSVDNDGNLNTNEGWKFTYNTGSMIAAGVKLYEITKEQAYLDQAKASAKGAYERWFVPREGRDYKVFTSANPWFNVLLLDGFTEVYRYDKSAYTYIKEYEANLDYAYENFRCEEGFMSSDWANGFKKDGEGKPIVKDLNVLDMAANAENFGHLAYFYQYIYAGADKS